MRSGFSKIELEVLTETRGAYFVWCIENAGTLGSILHHYRKNWLQRKNINGYKKSPKGTPLLLDKIINQFDRKIKGRSIFTDDVKSEYYKGIQEIMNEFYDNTFDPKPSRKDAYMEYAYEEYDNWKKQQRRYSKKPPPPPTKSFKEFVKSGLANKYKVISNYLK
jgi:hypothetical protein